MNNTLPDDIEQLKALLIAQQAVIVRLSGEITGYAREISSLRALVAKLQRMLFGRSSEKSREKIEKKILHIARTTCCSSVFIIIRLMNSQSDNPSSYSGETQNHSHRTR